MSRNARESLAAACFLVVFLGAAWLSLDFGPRARMIPLPLALAGAALALVQIVLCLRGAGGPKRVKIVEVDESALPPTAGVDVPAAAATPTRPEWTAYAVVVGLTALILAVGPVIAIFVFTAAYFARTRFCTVTRALVYAALFTGGVYLLFFTTLQVQPYYGVLAPLISLLP